MTLNFLVKTRLSEKGDLAIYLLELSVENYVSLPATQESALEVGPRIFGSIRSSTVMSGPRMRVVIARIECALYTYIIPA